MVTRRRFLRTGGTAALATALVGCDQLPDFMQVTAAGPLDEIGEHLSPLDTSIDLTVHFLNRLSFGPRPGDYAKVKASGSTEEEAIEVWLEEQLHPERIDDSACDRIVRRFESLDQPVGELFEYQEDLLLRELVRSTFLRAVYSERQLFETMALFWSDHFNIDSSKRDCQWLKTADDREVIRKHALGNFPAMLRASATSPAMLWYLDGRDNRKANPEDKPNENYARELLELHTLGVHGGYTQKDVMETARCLTGWHVRSDEKFQKGKVEFKQELHDDGEKNVLGHAISPGLGRGDLDKVLEIVSLHPSTARFLAAKLCRRFIRDDPPQSAIESTAQSFLNSGGDIPTTLRTLFGTEEFRSARGNKFKRPFRFLASALRATAADTDAGQEIGDYLQRMGHVPFQYPTPDGYPDEEAPWLGSLMWRWVFARNLVENRIGGTRIDADKLRQKVGDDEALMAHVLGRRSTIHEAHGYHSTPAGLALMLASPGFQRC